MEALTFAGFSYLGWAVGDVFGVIATRKLGGYSTTVWSLFFRLIIFAVYLPFAIHYLADLTLGMLFIILLIGSVGIIGFAIGVRPIVWLDVCAILSIISPYSNRGIRIEWKN